jgi:RNA polymerase sigma factor (TIGR02999 family)
LRDSRPGPDGDLPLTGHLTAWREGDLASADVVLGELYAQLHRMAVNLLRAERRDHTLQPTALVNELYLRLGAGKSPEWQSRTHFLAVVATTFRRILVDHARARHADRRGGGESLVPLDVAEAASACTCDELLMIDEALTQLEKAEPRAARVTELRFFAGLREAEIAEEMGVAEITVKRDWKFARAWLAARLKRG